MGTMWIFLGIVGSPWSDIFVWRRSVRNWSYRKYGFENCSCVFIHRWIHDHNQKSKQVSNTYIFKVNICGYVVKLWIFSRGLMKYVYEIMYDLSSLAVVNVRDLGNVKHAFKLLIFPDTRVFQCSSNTNKVIFLF